MFKCISRKNIGS